jgi:4-aminobutyrate aminotransferase-like enzyme
VVSIQSFSDREIVETAGLFVPCVRRWFPDEPILFVDGHGPVLKDSKGREYLDLLSSHGCVTLLGYNHPAVVEALHRQADLLYAVSVEFPNAPAVELANRLVEATPEALDRVYLANSGAEAVEVTMFLAKKYTRRGEFLSLYGDFHGRTHGARALLGYSPLKKGMGPYLSGVTRIPAYYCYRCSLGLEYPQCDLQCARLLEDALLYDTSGEPALFVAEPLQGTAGNIPAPPGYFQRIKQILDRHGILLFMDEIYTAFGSTGKKFCFEHYDLMPDFLTMSKTLGNGLPISAMLTRREISDSFAPPEPPLYFTTFGSNPLAAAGALAALNVILAERPWERAAELGEYWMKGLHKLQNKHELIGDVRGKGVMIGVELDKDRKTKEPAREESVQLKVEAGKRGVILPAGQGWLGNTIRMNPSVTFSHDQIDQALHVLDESFAAIRR